MSTTETAIRPEVAHDLLTAEASNRAAQASRDGQNAADTIHRIAGDHKDRRSGVWGMTHDEAITVARSTCAGYETRTLEDAIAALLQAITDRDLANAAFRELEEAYTGWSRFFLVTSSDGHIHSSMSCSTCYPTTVYGWHPTLSGLGQAEAVAELGEILCSVCFPDAPVAWTNGRSKASTEAADAKAAAKAERAAKKLAKALLPDGSDLIVEIGEQLRWSRNRTTGEQEQVSFMRTERFSTLHSAKTWLTDSFSWNRAANAGTGEPHPSFPLAAVDQVAEAVAAKLGTTAEAEKAAADKRARKRDGV